MIAHKIASMIAEVIALGMAAFRRKSDSHLDKHSDSSEKSEKSDSHLDKRSDSSKTAKKVIAI